MGDFSGPPDFFGARLERDASAYSVLKSILDFGTRCRRALAPRPAHARAGARRHGGMAEIAEAAGVVEVQMREHQAES